METINGRSDDRLVRFQVQWPTDPIWAERLIGRALQVVLEKDKPLWFDEFHEVANWLRDNEGRGLLIMGTSGRGKSTILQCVKLILSKKECIRQARALWVDSYSADEMNIKFDEVCSRKCVIIDDVGTEGEAVIYGNRIFAFSQVVNEAERHGRLLLASTNLTPDEIERKYGIRTLNRLKKICKVVTFTGDSLWGKK